MGALQQYRDELNLDVFLLTPSEAQSANKNCFVCQQERQRLQMAMGRIPQGEFPAPPPHNWQVVYTGSMLVALGRGAGLYKWLLTEIDT